MSTEDVCGQCPCLVIHSAVLSSVSPFTLFSVCVLAAVLVAVVGGVQGHLRR